MERTPSTEHVIPIEIIGHVNDVSEDEIDIDNFVESINSKIIRSKPSKCDEAQVEKENPSSNRESLIITHEDGSTEETECSVTCLGISSDSGSNQGLQIEDISQGTLKDNLAENKLKVIIPDMSQVIILEADEVTDPSFMSTPDIEESNQAMYDDMYNISFEKEESSTPRSDTPASTCRMTQEQCEDTKQNQKEGNQKQRDFIDNVESSNLKKIQRENINDTFHYAEETALKDLLEDVKIENNEPQRTELHGHCKPPFEEDRTQPINNTEPYNHEYKFLESKEVGSSAVSDSKSVDVKDTQMLEIIIDLDDEGSSEYKYADHISKKNSKERDASEEKRHIVETTDRDESRNKIVDKAKDQDKFPMKKVIAETVRIIPITLPDGRFVESGILSDDSVTQMEYNSSELIHDIEHGVKDAIKRDTSILGKTITARTVPILIESPEIPSTLEQQSKNNARDENSAKDKEEGAHNSNFNNHMEKTNIIETSSQSTDKLSETMHMKTCTEYVNQRVESKDISKRSSNTIICNFDNKQLHDAPNKNTGQLPCEDKRGLLTKDEQEDSEDNMDIQFIQPDQLEDQTVLKEKPAASNNIDALDAKRINPISDDYGILDKNKQTEATQQENTCSDACSRQLAEDFENELEINVPILIETVIEGKSETINGNKITSQKIENKGKDTKEESNAPINSIISTESFYNQMSRVSTEETLAKNEDDQIPISGTPNTQSLKQNASFTEHIRDSRDSEELTNSSISSGELKITVRQTELEDNKHSEKKLCQAGTKKESTYHRKLNTESSENQQIRNVPIYIETNLEGDSENIHINENTYNSHQNDEYADIGRNNQIKNDSTMDVKYSGEENAPIKIAPARRILPVVRTVPIQITGCTFAESENQDKNIKMEPNSNKSEQKKQDITIQRDTEHNNINSQILDKERKSDNKIELTEYCEAPKVDTKSVKQLNENETHRKTKHQDTPAQQNGVISVPIKIELPDETLGINLTKEANTENHAKDKQCKNSDEYHSSTDLNRASTKSEPEKDKSMNTSLLPPPPPVPTSKPPAVVRTIPILRQSLSDSGEGMARQQTGARQRNKSEQSTRGDILQKVHQELEEARLKLTAQANSLSSGLENITSPDAKPRNMFKRDRSLQDIDKDIETIWRELQELDKPDAERDINTQRSSCSSYGSGTPLSQVVLVPPSWRTPPPPSHSVRGSLSTPNIINANSKQPLPQTTIWDTQNIKGPMNEATTSKQFSSSWDSKPQYFPTKASTHFSFPPKAETKPGVITPSYVKPGAKSTHSIVRNIPIEKSEANAPKYEVPQQKGKDLEKESIHTKQDQENSRILQSVKSKSLGPGNAMVLNRFKSAENAPKPGGRSSDPDSPFEWVDFRKTDGEIVKGTFLPPLQKDNDVIISREVPIINVLLDDALKEETNPEAKTLTLKEKEPKMQNHTPPDGKHQKDNPETFNACDAGTQTEKFDKKSGCHIM